MNIENKIKGAYYGIQIGDALGAVVEGFSKKMIQKRYGRVIEYKSGIWGIPYFLRLEGSGTDDTRLSLAVLRGLLEKDPVIGLTKAFDRERFNFLHVGKTLFYAYLLHSGNWNQTSKRVDAKLNGNTAGNGALMRTLPVALLFNNWEEIQKYTVYQAEMTHLHPTSTESCLVYNKIAFLILQEFSLKESIIAATRNTKYENIYLQTPHVPPNGYSFYTLTWVLYWLCQSDTLEEAILGAVNEGGDADTIASLVGGISGLYYGFDAIPNHLLSIRGTDILDECAHKTYIFRSS
ncbi:ADP-ribosylglycohydrolase family protein [Brevibacillus sp. NPDC058079]|uniref:ADP-ribosylglycohydrolase family protein n=1 Tax=Brevibacillus sp. NPDC058079 TaxID=3346330 RepID=UPI0036E935AB